MEEDGRRRKYNAQKTANRLAKPRETASNTCENLPIDRHGSPGRTIMPSNSTPIPLAIAVLISGGGTTLKNLLDRAQGGLLPIDVRLVISSTDAAGGLVFAHASNVPSLVLRRRDSATPEDYSAAMFNAIRASGARYVVMGGFLQQPFNTC